MGLFIDPSSFLALLLMVLGGGVRDLASCVSTDTYWKAKSVTVSVEQLIRELDPIRPIDITKLVGELDADDPKTRDEASGKIATIGPAAIRALEEAANNGSPEVVSRANALLGKIRLDSKAASVRRLMAIRTLGERKDPAGLPVLRSLVDSKEPFEADYAAAAIAKIEGKTFTRPVATDADRAADVALLPSRLDVVAQVAPQIDGTLSIEPFLAQLPGDEQNNAKRLADANSRIIKLLDQVGNIQLDSLTWGFYAAPPGQPGNTMGIAHGIFDPIALSSALGKALPLSRNVDGVTVFQIDNDSAIMLADHGRVIFLSREPNGDLCVETMAAALKKGTGDFAANPDLPPLVKSIDTKAPMWAAARLGTGMKEIVGQLGDFDTATLVATQSPDNDQSKFITNIRLDAFTTDAALAKQSVEIVRDQLKNAVVRGRQDEKVVPFLKPLIDFAATVKLDVADGKATLNGTMHDAPILPAIMILRTVDQQSRLNP